MEGVRPDHGATGRATPAGIHSQPTQARRQATPSPARAAPTVDVVATRGPCDLCPRIQNLSTRSRGPGVFPDFTVEVYPERHHFDPPHRIEPERFAAALKRLWTRAESGQPTI